MSKAVFAGPPARRRLAGLSAARLGGAGAYARLDVDAGRPRAREPGAQCWRRLTGIVLCYGRLYGPGTDSTPRSGLAPLHVLRKAAALAVGSGSPGIYNVAEDDGAVTSEKAKRELGWTASWRSPA